MASSAPISWSVRPSVGHSIHPSVSSSICRSVHPSVGQFVHLLVSLSICRSIHPSVGQCVHPSVIPSIRRSVHPSLGLSVHLLVSPFICRSVSLSVGQSIHPTVSPSIHPSVTTFPRLIAASISLPSERESMISYIIHYTLEISMSMSLFARRASLSTLTLKETTPHQNSRGQTDMRTPNQHSD